MKLLYLAFLVLSLSAFFFASHSKVRDAINQDYDNHLKSLFVHFHQNPELSMGEVKPLNASRKSLKLQALKFMKASVKRV